MCIDVLYIFFLFFVVLTVLVAGLEVEYELHPCERRVRVVVIGTVDPSRSLAALRGDIRQWCCDKFISDDIRMLLVSFYTFIQYDILVSWSNNNIP